MKLIEQILCLIANPLKSLNKNSLQDNSKVWYNEVWERRQLLREHQKTIKSLMPCQKKTSKHLLIESKNWKKKKQSLSTWNILVLPKAEKSLKNLKKDNPEIYQQIQNILNDIDEEIQIGEDLVKGELAGKYKFKIGNYRVIYKIAEQTVIIIGVGHRSEVYQKGYL